MYKLDHGKLADAWLVMTIWQDFEVTPVEVVRLPDAQNTTMSDMLLSMHSHDSFVSKNKGSNGSER